MHDSLPDSIQDSADQMGLFVSLDGLGYHSGEGLECLRTHDLTYEYDWGLHICEGPPLVR